jgi:mRNA interferase RelE/StbE
MYTLKPTPAAERDIERLKRISRQDFERITRAIRALMEEPRPHGVAKLKGTDDGYRIRVGDYRVTYEVDDDDKTVVISHIRRRNEGTYRT